MRTVIVAKTRMWQGVCVGGFTMEEHQCVRLMPPGEDKNPVDTPFQIGQYGDIEFKPKEGVVPPHVEDVIFTNRSRLGELDDLRGYLLEHANIVEGPPSSLFEGRVQVTGNGSGYISHIGGVPTHSVGFWISDRDLIRDIQGDKARYCYPSLDSVREITYVGLQEHIPVIQSGTLIRVSLARWWAPEGFHENRCYLQLSGWYG